MEEFILAEVEDIVDKEYPYGEVDSQAWIYRIVANIDKDGYLSFEKQCAQVNSLCDELDFQKCSDLDVHKSEFSVKELKRLLDYLQK